jgi:hypothetical protein
MKLFKAVKMGWIVWVWNHTPTCAEMSRLASLSFEQRPSLKVRYKMWLHYLICVWCERYLKHFKFLHRIAPRLPEHLRTTFNQTLPTESKRRMVARLHEEWLQ